MPRGSLLTKDLAVYPWNCVKDFIEKLLESCKKLEYCTTFTILVQ